MRLSRILRQDADRSFADPVAWTLATFFICAASLGTL